MDRKYLEEYEQREREEYDKLIKKIQKGGFDFEKDKYPPNARFVNLRRPVALAGHRTSNTKDVWGQIPFCGSLILSLPAFQKDFFEECFFKIGDIAEIVAFIKETGRLQITLQDYPTRYAGLDYFDEIFEELNPPVLRGCPLIMFGNAKEIQEARMAFLTLGKVNYFPHLWKIAQELSFPGGFKIVVERGSITYTLLKLGRYALVEEIEASMIDNPQKALELYDICQKFIFGPRLNLRSGLMSYTLDETKTVRNLPVVYHPQEMRFPCEIGKFLIEKMTNAPLGMRACYDIIDHYDAYDLQKVQESLNEAIVTNHPDVLDKSVEDLSEILDNVWNDKTIPKQIKNIRRGAPISIAAIGSAVSAVTGGLIGFLAGLGFSVGAKILDHEIEGLAERSVEFFARSYQVNVYDFKKKYKSRILRS